jgi:hypothetical protein
LVADLVVGVLPGLGLPLVPTPKADPIAGLALLFMLCLVLFAGELRAGALAAVTRDPVRPALNPLASGAGAGIGGFDLDTDPVRPALNPLASGAGAGKGGLDLDTDPVSFLGVPGSDPGKDPGVFEGVPGLDPGKDLDPGIFLGAEVWEAGLDPSGFLGGPGFTTCSSGGFGRAGAVMAENAGRDVCRENGAR